ncbi:hypothetical protein GGX14DRAFT_404176 [Mycena pura]|uniref:Uncharacterized protein n=1 Tax=Mycena pura TaxID=153505 RepID=A0AAD6UUL6_9AGAR|nr:hypothetical protein GGX14DRAFT_404176 [Mycena pura]
MLIITCRCAARRARRIRVRGYRREHGVYTGVGAVRGGGACAGVGTVRARAAYAYAGAAHARGQRRSQRVRRRRRTCTRACMRRAPAGTARTRAQARTQRVRGEAARVRGRARRIRGCAREQGRYAGAGAGDGTAGTCVHAWTRHASAGTGAWALCAGAARARTVRARAAYAGAGAGATTARTRAQARAAYSQARAHMPARGACAGQGRRHGAWHVRGVRARRVRGGRCAREAEHARGRARRVHGAYAWHVRTYGLPLVARACGHGTYAGARASTAHKRTHGGRDEVTARTPAGTARTRGASTARARDGRSTVRTRARARAHWGMVRGGRGARERAHAAGGVRGAGAARGQARVLVRPGGGSGQTCAGKHGEHNAPSVAIFNARKEIRSEQRNGGHQNFLYATPNGPSTSHPPPAPFPPPFYAASAAIRASTSHGSAMNADEFLVHNFLNHRSRPTGPAQATAHQLLSKSSLDDCAPALACTQCTGAGALAPACTHRRRNEGVGDAGARGDSARPRQATDHARAVNRPTQRTDSARARARQRAHCAADGGGKAMKEWQRRRAGGTHGQGAANRQCTRAHGGQGAHTRGERRVMQRTVRTVDRAPTDTRRMDSTRVHGGDSMRAADSGPGPTHARGGQGAHACLRRARPRRTPGPVPARAAARARGGQGVGRGRRVTWAAHVAALHILLF